jgi:hypothetical protein
VRNERAGELFTIASNESRHAAQLSSELLESRRLGAVAVAGVFMFARVTGKPSDQVSKVFFGILESLTLPRLDGRLGGTVEPVVANTIQAIAGARRVL